MAMYDSRAEWRRLDHSRRDQSAYIARMYGPEGGWRLEHGRRDKTTGVSAIDDKSPTSLGATSPQEEGGRFIENGCAGAAGRQANRARCALVAAAAAQRPGNRLPHGQMMPLLRIRLAATTSKDVPNRAADWEKAAGEKPAVRLPASVLDGPMALARAPRANDGSPGGEVRRGERVRLRQRQDGRPRSASMATSISMPALPARPARAASKPTERTSNLQALPFLEEARGSKTSNFRRREEARLGGAPSPQELAQKDSSCFSGGPGLSRLRRDHSGSPGRGDAPERPAGRASRPKGDDTEPRVTACSRQVSTTSERGEGVEPRARGLSRQVATRGTPRSRSGSPGTPVATLRTEKACSAQSEPPPERPRPPPPDAAVEIHKYAKEMAVPLDSMRTAFSLFKDHAVVPLDGNLLTDGYLARSNFVPLFRQMAGEALAAEEEEVYLDRAMKSADNDTNGVLSFREFAIWYSSHSFIEGFHLDAEEQALRKLARKLGVSATEIDGYKRHFDSFDADGSGSIDEEEFQEVLYKCGNVPRHIGLPASRVKQLWMAADADGGGDVDFEEFVVFFRKYFQKRMGDLSGFERFYSQGLSSLVRAG